MQGYSYSTPSELSGEMCLPYNSEGVELEEYRVKPGD